MKKNFFYLFFIIASLGVAQTPGLIYQRVQGELGQKVLDPNNDGFISLTSSGFSGTDYGVNSELRMIPLPVIQGEPHSDLTTGAGGGHTDIVSALVGGVASRESAYILYRTVDGIPYVVIRMRIGKASTSPKGYSFLLNTDGSFITGSTGTNPGYDREIVLQTGNGAIVAVYIHNGATTTLSTTFPAANYSQRSIALSAINGDADYFYDFFIPFSALGITNNPVGITAATVTSAGSGISGTISDFNGVDDRLYGGDRNLIMSALISSFPAVPITELTESFDYENLYKPKTLAPVVNEGILATSTSISGNSMEANGTVITVFKNGVSIGTTTVNNNAWTLTGVSGLAPGNLITATALASNKTASDVSNAIIVSSAQQECFISAPINIVRAGSNQATNAITGSWTGDFAPNGSNVRIRLYTQSTTDPNVFNEFTVPGTSNQFVNAGGTFSIIVNLANNVFSTLNFIAKAENVSNGCLSGFSNVTIRTNGNATANGFITPKPTIQNITVFQSNSSQQITVLNNGVDAGTTDVNGVTIPASPVPSILNLYINGALFAQSGSTIAANGSHIFSVPSLSETDVLSARAQGIDPTQAYWLSYVSNLVTVQLNTPTQTLAPRITGTYIAGSGITITGTSTEAAGTEIKVYKAGTTLLGTVTVSTFGTWQLTGVTLATSDILTATAKALNKSLSSNSNSVTVQASAPSAPTVSGSYIAGNTSISGTGGNTSVRIYVDGSLIGTATPSSGNWTLSGLSSTELYRGAVINATNIVNGIESVISNSVTVTGVVSFCITDENGNALTDKFSGQAFNVRITAKSASGCGAGNFTSYANNANLSSNKWFDPSGPTSNFSGGVLTLTNVVLGGVGSATINAISPDDPTVTGSVTINITKPSVWVGTTSTNFNTASNWKDNFVPGPNAAVRFASVALDGENAVNDCHLDANRVIGDLDFNGSTYKLNLNGKKLDLRGQISNSNSSTGSWISNATSELEVKGYGNTGTLHFASGSEILNLTLNNTSSGALTLGSALALRGVLNVVNGSFNAGNALLTFKSNATKTAIVAPVTGSISGNVIVERYYPAKRSFRLVTSPVTTTTTIRANWQEGVNNTTTTYSSNLNPNPGFGTHITGDITSDKGFDRTNTTNSSMFTFNYLSNAWVAVPNTNVLTLTAGDPYRLMIRGDRSIDYNTNNPTPTNTTLRTTGTLFTGTKTYSFSSIPPVTQYLLIGNPYQSPVDTKKVLRASTGLTDNFMYYWDPRINTRGAFVTLNHDELNELNDIKSVGSSQISRYIQPGQAAFVRKATSATSASVVFQESHKYTAAAATNTLSVFRNASQNSQNALLRIELYESQMYQNQQQALDGLVVKFNPNYSSQLDDFDAPKVVNQDEDFACKLENQFISILSHNMPLENEEIPLYNAKYRHQNYTLVAELTNYDGFVPFVYDAFTQQYHQLNPQTTTFNFTVSSSVPASIAADRFKLVFRNVTLGSENFEANTFLYPNPTSSGEFNITTRVDNEGVVVNLYNSLGQRIPLITTNANSYTINCKPQTSLQAGIYLVAIEKEGIKINKRIIIK